MRSLSGLFAVVVVCGLATAAVGGEACWGCQAGAGYGPYAGLCAGACAAPGFGLVPGCCEWSPSCCTHVWDGYCQERRGCGCGLYGSCWRARGYSYGYGFGCASGCFEGPACDCSN